MIKLDRLKDILTETRHYLKVPVLIFDEPRITTKDDQLYSINLAFNSYDEIKFSLPNAFRELFEKINFEVHNETKECANFGGIVFSSLPQLNNSENIENRGVIINVSNDQHWHSIIRLDCTFSMVYHV